MDRIELELAREELMAAVKQHKQEYTQSSRLRLLDAHQYLETQRNQEGEQNVR